MGTRERFERLSDHLEELYTERVRLYALRKTSGAPSSPSWENKSGGGMAGDRVGGAAVKAAELERRSIRWTTSVARRSGRWRDG